MNGSLVSINSQFTFEFLIMVFLDLVLFSCSVMPNSLQFHGLQHSRLSCPHLPEFAQTHVRWVADAIQPSHPLPSLLLLPSIFPSLRVFSSESALHIRWPKYQSFSFNINPSNEYSVLISFRIDWLNRLIVQGTLKSLLECHTLKASALCSAFFWPSIHTWLLEKP